MGTKKRKKSKSQIGMFVAFGVISIIALTSVIYGVVTTPDAELLEVCWSANGTAQYVNDMPEETRICTDPVQIIWENDNLKVVVIDNGNIVSFSDIDRSVKYALRMVNRNLKTNLEFVDSLGEADIVLDWRAPYETGNLSTSIGDSAGYCIHERRNGRMTAHAAVRAQGTNVLEHRVTMHELGHCLGLQHDQIGIMETPTRDRDLPRFSDEQVSLMKETYP